MVAFEHAHHRRLAHVRVRVPQAAVDRAVLPGGGGKENRALMEQHCHNMHATKDKLIGRSWQAGCTQSDMHATKDKLIGRCLQAGGTQPMRRAQPMHSPRSP